MIFFYRHLNEVRGLASYDVKLLLCFSLSSKLHNHCLVLISSLQNYYNILSLQPTFQVLTMLQAWDISVDGYWFIAVIFYGSLKQFMGPLPWAILLHSVMPSTKWWPLQWTHATVLWLGVDNNLEEFMEDSGYTWLYQWLLASSWASRSDTEWWFMLRWYYCLDFRCYALRINIFT